MELERFSPNGQLPVLQLSPLSDDDIRQILQNNYNVADPLAFVEQAERHRIAPLLSNPQMLGLMARAVSSEHWPESSSEVYRLACEKLAQEHNPYHRQTSEAKAVDSETVLKAAGQLFAVQLLSGKTGIATDLETSDAAHPALDQFKPEQPSAARRALQSALFSPATGHAERLIPCHRSVAEYLAAQWLAEKLDRKSLPHGRLLKLLLGFDGGVVADLRGLLAWLARHSTSIRTRLIDADPLGIVLYGDVRSFSTADKRHLLQALRQQAERFPGFRWHLWQDMSAFGALADDALLEDFRDILQTPERDEASQSHIDCVLDILEYGHTAPSLAAPLLAVLKDASLWPRLRYAALRGWLQLASPVEIKDLLSKICSNQVEDEDDELLGKLLDRLYPEHLTPDEMFLCLHPPKNARLIGCYRMFWEHRLPESTPTEQLPALLEAFSARTDVFDEDHADSWLSRSTDRLLVRTLNELGESATDEQLFTWLGAGANQYGNFHRDRESGSLIRQWLEQHPERYKAVLAQCIQVILSSRYSPYPRLHNAAPPADIGLWHLHLAGTSEERAARVHLQHAVNSLIGLRGAEGLSLEAIEAWGRDFPTRSDWLDYWLVCDLEQERRSLEDAAHIRSYRERRAEQRRQRTQHITSELPAIAAGTAAPYLLQHLAIAWLNQSSYIRGETISARFASYSDLGDELMLAAESGFRHCRQRSDLPSAADIIALHQSGPGHHIALPCLLGLQLDWTDAPEKVAALPDSLIERLLAFHLCSSYFGLDDLNSWASQMAKQHPELFARVLIQQSAAAFAAGNTYSRMAYSLARDAAYAQVAQLAVPELLRHFPESAAGEQLRDLKKLLKAALIRAPGSLAGLASHKLASTTLHAEQRLPWLALQLLTEQSQNEEIFWQQLGDTVGAEATPLLTVEILLQGLQLQMLQSPQAERIAGRLLASTAPYAELERLSGFVTMAMDLGDKLRGMLDWLGSQSTTEAGDELRHLLDCPALATQRYRIQSTLEQQQARRREAEFQFLELKAVADVLANRRPANVEDLAWLTLHHLDDIAHELGHANDDGYRAFWNITKGKSTGRREENLCRDILLTRLRSRLNAHSISIAPEYDHAGDKRADLHLDYNNQLSLPIEIKRDDHAELWTALRDQLMALYVRAPKSAGHGIYLVLWFGDSANPVKSPPDGSPRPASPEELQSKLEALLNTEERRRIFVRVLNVSWPAPRPAQQAPGRLKTLDIS